MNHKLFKTTQLLTIVLGKLGIKCLVGKHSAHRIPMLNPNNDPRFDEYYSYGWNFWECKSFIGRFLGRHEQHF